MNQTKAQLKDVISENLSAETLRSLLKEIDKEVDESSYHFSDIDIRKIYPNPNQPRQHFDEDKIKELADSIKIHGLLTPIMVQKEENGYMIIAGERRYRAVLSLNKPTIKCIVCSLSTKAIDEISLIENIQREDLNVMEEATAYQTMIQKYGYTQEEVAARIGKSRTHVTNMLRLLKLPNAIREEILTGNLSGGHARSLLSLEKEEEMMEAMKEVVTRKMSVRETERYVKEKKRKGENRGMPEVANLSSALRRKITVQGHKVIIHCADGEDLQGLLGYLKAVMIANKK